MPTLWRSCGRVWGRVIAPWMRDREFSYYNRPHCAWPRLHTTAWQAQHILCGEPVADTLNLQAVRTMANLLSGGKDVGQVMPNSGIARLLMMPNLLESLAHGPDAPVCAVHLDQFWGDVNEALELALPEDQERFKQWLKEQPPRKSPGQSPRKLGAAMAARLNGWQRLWIVLAILYLLPILGLTVAFWPTPERTYHRDEFLSRMPAELRRRIHAAYASEWAWKQAREDVLKAFPTLNRRSSGGTLSDQEFERLFPPPLTFPNGATLQLSETRKDGPDSDSQVAGAYWEVVESEFRAQRWRTGFGMALVWLVPCVALYALGWAAAWIIRGFRGTRTPKEGRAA